MKDITKGGTRLAIDVERLDESGERISGFLDPAENAERPDDFLHAPISKLGYDLFVQRLGGELLARGRVWQDFRCMCVRCTKEFDLAVSDTLETSIELGDEMFPDLTDELNECIILSLPCNPLCDEGCKGLCPRCGADLNKGDCGCKPGGDARWAGLDGLETE